MDIKEWCDLYGLEQVGYDPERCEYLVRDRSNKKEYKIPSYIVEQGKGIEAKEQVNHPSHYNLPGRKECIEEMVDIFGKEAVGSWCLITAYKYAYRAGEKDGNSADQDRAKINWYLSWYMINIGPDEKYHQVASLVSAKEK